MATTRLIVPDTARGMALLGIAIANMTTAWIISEDRPGAYFGGILNDSLLDKIAVVFGAFFVHNRGLPMFSTLLGFGVGLIAMSLWRRGFPLREARRVIAKRYGFLALFGAVHMVLLFWGDIMFVYGIAGIVIALLLTLHNSTLRKISYGALGVMTVLGICTLIFSAIDGGADIPFEGIGTVNSFGDLLLSQLLTLGAQVISTPLIILMYLPVMLVGFVWAREGVLADVPSHRPQLLRWVAIAAAVTLVIGVLWSLGTLEVIDQRWADAANSANSILGVLTGPGILAGLALVLQPVQERHAAGAPVPAVLWPFIALGKRSMSGYVAQSILFFLLVHPFTLDFGHDLGAFGQAALACGVWGVTVVGACILEALGLRGPFEVVHRRLSYGPRMRPERSLPSQGVN
ncbi:DUF418 domain-containing protein [Corynebacterium macginleyi]|uniref:DUF418 domain-containing protein n=1 Tax=Corynebacterium macginleyi TaxID=38290 RepID=UPI0019090BB8|nr:DUF418 domain-containing protein [Corynebacterium macginleyi]MBK4142121.1 DUF418 domain-containing protein [Corynebacterium macginleyi]